MGSFGSKATARTAWQTWNAPIQEATFSFTDFAVWARKIQDGRMAHHAKTTTLSMLPWQVNPQREACQQKAEKSMQLS
jgi:hypothetical protein